MYLRAELCTYISTYRTKHTYVHIQDMCTYVNTTFKYIRTYRTKSMYICTYRYVHKHKHNILSINIRSEQYSDIDSMEGQVEGHGINH